MNKEIGWEDGLWWSLILDRLPKRFFTYFEIETYGAEPKDPGDIYENV